MGALVSNHMTNSNRVPEANDEVRKATARARKFLAASGINSTALIHREDAAHFMVGFALLEKEVSEEVRSARKVMKDRHDALRKLADS